MSSPPDIIPFHKIGIYNSALNVFNTQISNSSLTALEINSNSSIYNISTFFASLILFAIFHLSVKLLSNLFNKCEPKGIWKGFISTIKLILKKIVIIFTYGYYIRFILETNQFLLLSSMNEVYTMNTSDSVNILSLLFAWFVLSSWIFLIAIVTYLSLSSYEVSQKDHSKIEEIFTGLKMQKKTKFYSSFLIMRRTVLVILLISLSSMNSRLMISILWFIQLAYLIYIATSSPFLETKWNIIEWVNEVFFIFLLSYLLLTNDESDWTNSITSAYTWTVATNSITVCIIVIGRLSKSYYVADFTRILAIKVYKKIWKPKPVEVYMNTNFR